MTNPNSTEFKTSLTDEHIVEIAQKIDKLIVEIGKEYSPSGIEFAAIALGRLMVFTKHTECFDTFSKMMDEVARMREPEPLVKTEQ
jgi:hypothetical protein